MDFSAVSATRLMEIDMATLDEIRVYLDKYPDDHKQRWRLAKRLYRDCQYLSALEHLKILREVWPDQLPVLSYLAATYYRHGKYEKAEAELTSALEKHPEEYAILKHLAKVYEEMGHSGKALKIWKQALVLRPSRQVEENIARLGVLAGYKAENSATSKPPISTLLPPDSDETVRLCPFCDMKNDLFNHRCIGCHREFGGT